MLVEIREEVLLGTELPIHFLGKHEVEGSLFAVVVWVLLHSLVRGSN